MYCGAMKAISVVAALWMLGSMAAAAKPCGRGHISENEVCHKDSGGSGSSGGSNDMMWIMLLLTGAVVGGVLGVNAMMKDGPSRN